MKSHLGVESSKFVSYVLRHDPDSIGLALDANGWARVDAFVACARKQGRAISREDLWHIAASGDKKRFVFSDDGERIRAAHGHSVGVEPVQQPKAPPARLFHGTATRFLDPIMAFGLKPQGRRFVHLSVTIDQAMKIGARHGKPIVLAVDAAGMAATGAPFYESESGVWLVEAVPPSFLSPSSLPPGFLPPSSLSP